MPTIHRAMVSEQGYLMGGIDNRQHFSRHYGPDEGYDEEFDGYGIADDVLPTSWSMLNQDTSVYRQAFGAGRIDWGGGGDASNLHSCVRTLPATTTFDAFFHLWGLTDLTSASASYLHGVVLHNSANGDYVFCGLHQTTATSAPQYFISAWSDADTQGSTLATGPVLRAPGGPQGWYRITKQADNNYDFYANTDGGCWFTVAANIDVNTSLGADPTHIGFTLNTVGAAHVGCEWFRLRGVT